MPGGTVFKKTRRRTAPRIKIQTKTLMWLYYSKKQVMKIIGFYILSFFVTTAVFILLFHTPLLAGNIYFYRGIGLLVITTLLAAAMMLIFKKSHWGNFLTFKDILLALVLISNLNMTFFTLVPVTVERSVSVYLLGYLNKTSEPKNKEQITKDFIDVYILKNEAMEKRFEEQEASGNINRQGDAISVTEQGRSILRLYNRISDIYNIGNKVIEP